MDEDDRFACEQPACCASGLLDPAGDVARRFPQIQRRDLAPQRHALFELPQRVLVEAGRKCRLSYQHEREQLLGAGFDVRQ